MWSRTENGWADINPCDPTSRRLAGSAAKSPETRESNDIHDQQHGNPHKWPRIRSAWNPEALMPKKPLTDAIVEKRRKQGYYTDEHREAIRKLVEAKSDAMQKREEKP